MRRRFLVPILLLAISCSSTEWPAEPGNETAAVRLVADTGARVEDLSCRGGHYYRNIYCGLTATPENFTKLAAGLELTETQDVSEIRSGTYAVVHEPADPCEHPARPQLPEQFFHQQWVPARGAFAGSIVLRHAQNDRACLLLALFRG